MKFSIQELFSPFELNVGMLVLVRVLGLLTMIGLVTGRVKGGIVAGVLTLIVFLLLAPGSDCPTCGKSPLITYGGSGWIGRHIWALRRLWPEHVCSHCGTDLDAIPEQES